MSEFQVRSVDSEAVAALRNAVISRYTDAAGSTAGDDAPLASHVGAFREEDLVGVGSIHPEAMPDGFRVGAWRLHGLAVEHGFRGRGIGSMLVERLLEHAAANEARGAWCLAPAGAFGFFERYGFRRAGPPIEREPGGPHYTLFVQLGPLRRSWAPDASDA